VKLFKRFNGLGHAVLCYNYKRAVTNKLLVPEQAEKIVRILQNTSACSGKGNEVYNRIFGVEHIPIFGTYAVVNTVQQMDLLHSFRQYGYLVG